MAITKFPPLEMADKSGLLAIGGDLEVESLKLAYSQGIFPWPYSDDFPLSWYAPDPRGVLDFDHFRVSHSFKKFLKKNPFEIRFNHQFAEVIKRCASSRNRGGQRGTWITPRMIKAYVDFYQSGYAFSVESYLEGKLVGGLYGVIIDRFVSGESMFYLASNASKVALWALVEQLKKHQIEWMDTQMITPILAQMGGREIPRPEFMDRIRRSISKGLPNREIFNER